MPRSGGRGAGDAESAARRAVPLCPFLCRRRGYHLYFTAGPATWTSRIGLRPGIDVRAATGYVIAPPSVGANGDYVCVSACDPAPAPSWLSDALLKVTIPDSSRSKSDEWVETALRGAPDGERDVTATALAGHFLRRGISPAVTETVLLDCFAARCTPPMAAAEVRKIVKSIGRAEQSKHETQLFGDRGLTGSVG